LQKTFCAEITEKAKALGYKKVFDLEEILEEIHDEESEGEAVDEEEEWEELPVQRSMLLKTLVDEYEGVLKEYLRVVGM
jgi:hypothetical protein